MTSYRYFETLQNFSSGKSREIFVTKLIYHLPSIRDVINGQPLNYIDKHKCKEKKLLVRRVLALFVFFNPGEH